MNLCVPLLCSIITSVPSHHPFPVYLNGTDHVKGHRQFNELMAKCPWVNGSEAHCDARHLGPSREGSVAGLAMISGGGVGGTAEEICDLIMS